jgi:hypothetical protein
MRIAVLSDTHNNERNTLQALELVLAGGAELVLHCGDICDTDTARLFDRLPTHFVKGNNDYDLVGLQATIRAVGGTWHGAFADLELAGRRIAMLHGDHWQQLDRAIHGGSYDYVFFGHTHVFERNRAGHTIVLNPGALHRASPKTCALIDLTTGRIDQILVAD